jgi:hypothetical protein
MLKEVRMRTSYFVIPDGFVAATTKKKFHIQNGS